MKKIVISCVLLATLLLASCSPSQNAIQEAIEQTKEAELAFSSALDTALAKTQLAMPTNTPTITLAPTVTITPTVTPLPTKPGTIDMGWEFNQPGSFGGWGANDYDTNLEDLQIVNGFLTGRAISAPPNMLYNRNLRLDGDNIDTIEIAMRVSNGGNASLYFGTESDPKLDEGKNWPFRVQASDEVIVYSIPISLHSAWQGIITELRFDPIDVPDTLIEIDYIRLISSSED